MPYDGRLLDTEGHTSEVWNGAVKETLREGRRLRAALFAAMAAPEGSNCTAPLTTNNAPPLPAGASRAARYERYQRLWRARLVSLIAHRRRCGGGRARGGVGGEAPPPDDKALREYFTDFMGGQLELRSLVAKEEEERRRRPRQLVCYRSIVITHNHRGLPRYSTERGTLSLANVPTCHDAEGLKNAYEAITARFFVPRRCARHAFEGQLRSSSATSPHRPHASKQHKPRRAPPLHAAARRAWQARRCLCRVTSSSRGCACRYGGDGAHAAAAATCRTLSACCVAGGRAAIGYFNG